MFFFSGFIYIQKLDGWLPYGTTQTIGNIGNVVHTVFPSDSSLLCVFCVFVCCLSPVVFCPFATQCLQHLYKFRNHYGNMDIS